MTILITGAAGFIGSRLADWILKNTNDTVIGIDNLSVGFESNIPKNMKFHILDCNSDSAELLFIYANIDVVIHCAAYASEGRSNHIRGFIHQNNTLSTAKIINHCVNYNCKLIFLSSVAVYSGKPPYSEDTVPNPIDEYGLSKLTSEKSIEIASKVHGLQYTIVRPRNVYGIGQNMFDPSRNLMGILCYNAINKLPIKIFGDGLQIRSFTYIDDILAPLYNCIDQKCDGHVINLGSSVAYSVKMAVDVFSEISNYSNIRHVEERHEVKEAFCLVYKSKKMLGFKDKTSLHEGIKKMWEWALEQKMRPLMEPPPLEIKKSTHSSLNG